MHDTYTIDGDFKIIAGGQTGADIAAPDWAIMQGISHCGWCPKGRKAEEGVLPEQYKLVETPSASYLEWAEWNVRDADATLIFTLGDKLEGGSKRTAEYAERLGKPWLHMRPGVHPKYVVRFLHQHQVMVLNVAGSRGSLAPSIGLFVWDILAQALHVPLRRLQDHSVV